MRQARVWEITADRKFTEIQARSSGLEQWLEEWLASDISVVDPSLMVIGRQVRTAFGGVIDLLCTEMSGDLVIVELKSSRTPREVTAQALDYSYWVKDLEFDEVVNLADRYLGGPGSLEAAFRERFETELPEQLNQGHRALVVADSVDSSTVRIVRYLGRYGCPRQPGHVARLPGRKRTGTAGPGLSHRTGGGPSQRLQAGWRGDYLIKVLLS